MINWILSHREDERLEHGVSLTREMLVENTTILDTSNDKRRLQIKEALYISTKRPVMNIQVGTTSIPLPSQNRQQLE